MGAVAGGGSARGGCVGVSTVLWWRRASGQCLQGSRVPPPPPEGTLGYVTCALAANSTKRRKKMGSSVAYKTIGTFLSQNKRHEDACG